jgi:F-type H+-transporting ATPase subunit epsilon
MATIKLQIITPEETVTHDEVAEITIPTGTGEITVLPDHAPLVSTIKTGEVRLKKDGQTRALAVHQGVLEVRPDSQVILLTQNTEFADQIDTERAEKALKRAQEAMEQQSNDIDIDFARLQAQMERELNRLNVAKKWRK